MSNSSIFDSSQLTIADYEIEFTSATTFEIIDQDTGLKLDATKVSINGGPFGTDPAVKSFTFSSNTTAEFEGIRVAIQKFGGDPQKGDSFSISVKKGAARSIAFNSLLGAEINKIAAAGSPGAPGDNDNALALANLRGSTVAGRGSATLSEFMNGIISNFGSNSGDIQSRRDLTEQVTESLKATREEVSGVSIDEELANIIQFQQNFGASARLMSTVADLLQQIIDIL